MFTLYRPTYKDAEKAINNLNLGACNLPLESLSDPLERLHHIKGRMPIVTAESKLLPELNQAYIEAIREGALFPVVNVDCNTLTEVFRLTNHYNYPEGENPEDLIYDKHGAFIGDENIDPALFKQWFENPEINLTFPEGLTVDDFFLTPTSVGDVINKGKDWWMVGANGFIKLT